MAKQIEIDLLIKTAKSVKSTEAQKAILLEIYDALKQVEKGSTAFDTLSEAANGLKTNLGGVNASFEDIYGDVQPLTTRLGELEDRMYELASAGQQNTQEFKDLQTEAIKMRKTIIDVDASIDAFAQKGAKIKAFSGIVSGMAGAFGTAQAAVGLFGGSTEGFEKSLLKLQQVMMIMQGVQEVSNLLTEKNIILEKIANFNRGMAVKLVGEKVVATAAEAVATGTATIAQRALNAAMSANPIGLIIVAVVTLIGLYSAFGDEAEDTTKKMEDMNKSLDENNDKLDLNAKRMESSSNTYKQSVTSMYEISTRVQQAQIEMIQHEMAMIEAKAELTDADHKRLRALKKEEYDWLISQQEAQNGIYETDLKTKQRDLKTSIDTTRDKILNEKDFLKTSEELRKKAVSDGDATRVLEIETEQTKHENILEDLKINLEYQKVAYEVNQDEYRLIGSLKIRSLKKLEEEYTVWTKQEAVKREEDAKKIEAERRSRLLDEINNILLRQKSANGELNTLAIDQQKELQKKELEYQELTYGKVKEDVIGRAIERELKKNEEAFLKKKEIGKADAEVTKQYLEDRKKITENGVDYLIEEEKKLLTEKEKENEKIKNIIKNRFIDEAKITALETIKINAERIQLEVKYQKDSEILSAQKIKDTDDQAKAILDINQKYANSEKKSVEDLYKAELNLLKENYAQKIKLAEEQYGKESEQVKNLKAKQALDEKRLEQVKGSDIVAIAQSTIDKKISAEDGWLEYKKQLLEDLLALEQTIADTILSFIEQETNERLKQNDLIYQDKLKKIDAEEQKYRDLVANRTIAEQATYDIEQGFEDQRTNAERARQLEEDRIKKKQFDAQKINDAASIAINYGVAIAKAFRDFGWPAGLIPAGILGVQLGLAEAAVLNKKYIPQYATGGIHYGDGAVNGPGTGTSDDINAKLSNGEIVINAKSSKKFAPMLSAINQAGGGKKIPYLKSGGTFISTTNDGSNTSMSGGYASVQTMDIQPLVDAIQNQNKEVYVKESTVTNAQNNAEKLKRRTRF